MKKNKHITININEYIYNDIVFLADDDRRTITEYLYLLVIDEIKKRMIKKADLKSSGFNKLDL